MNFFQRLFGSAEEDPEEKKKETEARNFDALKYDGIAALKTGQLEYATTCFTHALQIKDDLEIHDHLSQAYIHQNLLQKAIDELRILAAAQPDNQAIWIRMARVCYMMEDYTEMAEACTQAQATGEANADVSYLSAEAQQGLGDNAAAVELLDKTISQNAKFGAAYLLRGQILLSMNRLQEAEADADYLLQHAEPEEDIVLLKARIAYQGGDTKKAVEWYGRVTDTNPFCVAAFRERAKVYEEMGETALAAADTATADELEPKDAANVDTEQSAEGIEQKTKEAYKNTLNPFGL